MSRTLNGSSDLIAIADAAIVAAYSATLACWFKEAAAVDSDRSLFSMSRSGLDTHFLTLRTSPGSTERFAELQARQGLQSSVLTGTVDLLDGAWHHLCAVFAASNNRTLYTDGGDARNSVAAVNYPLSLDRTTIGALRQTAVTEYAQGTIAEAGIWEWALADAEVMALARGFSPLCVRPGKLVGYWPLIGRTSPEQNKIGDEHGTLTGTAVSDHPPIMYPAPPMMGHRPGIAAVAMHHYRRRRAG